LYRNRLISSTRAIGQSFIKLNELLTLFGIEISGLNTMLAQPGVAAGATREPVEHCYAVRCLLPNLLIEKPAGLTCRLDPTRASRIIGRDRQTTSSRN
jgi:hypothetical protein